MHSRVIAAVAASISFSLCLAASIYCMADLAGGSARQWLDSWDDTGRITDLRDWNTVHERLLLAGRLAPLSADHAAELGRVLEWRAWQHAPDSPLGAELRQAASRHYGDALLHRPSWGYAWALYAENRLLSGAFDDLFLHALNKAMELAPWEPLVQRKVAWMGMATWNDLPADARSLVKDSISRAMALDVYRYEVIRLAFQYDWLEELRPMVRDDRQRAAYEFVLRQLNRR